MKMAVVGGDRRFALFAQLATEQGYEVIVCPDWASCPEVNAAVAMNAPPPSCRTLPEGSCLFLLTGKPIEETLRARYRVHSFTEDSAFALENARYTAEGALAAAMNRMDDALTASRAMVVGYGRIGRALTELLVGMHVRTTVVSRRENGRIQAMSRGAIAISPDEMIRQLPDHQVIFVTSPERMMGENELQWLHDESVVIDLSSAPYGVDVECAAAKKHLAVWREPGLPGRYCPRSAARAMLRMMMRMGKEDGEP